MAWDTVWISGGYYVEVMTQRGRMPTQRRPDLEKPITFYPFSADQVVDDILKIPPKPRVKKPKKTAKAKRGKKRKAR